MKMLKKIMLLQQSWEGKLQLKNWEIAQIVQKKKHHLFTCDVIKYLIAQGV
jgi:hypothetical protein